jgi:hypothetical protein
VCLKPTLIASWLVSFGHTPGKHKQQLGVEEDLDLDSNDIKLVTLGKWLRFCHRLLELSVSQSL